MKKVIIFYATYGGGHLSAAKSICNYIEHHYPNIHIEMIDCIKYINKFLDKVTTGAYREMAKNTPKLWGKVYKNSQKGFLGHFSSRVNKLMAKKLKKLIIEETPNIIISTHPFSSQMINYIKRKNNLTTPLATVLTDFASHEQWLIGHKYTNYFFVSNDNMKKELCDYGIAPEKIYVSGIPLSERFFEPFDKSQILDTFQLSPNQKVILFFGGGEMGLGQEKTIKILHSLITTAPNYQIVAIAGKNEKMKAKFEQLVEELNIQSRVKVLGFIDKIPELMSISSLVVTKPGGLTSSESLASHLPIIIINPIPGQEEQNAEFLVSNGVGIWIKSQDNPDEIFANLFNSNEKIEEMRENTKKFCKSYSTKNICETIFGKTEEK